MTTTTTVRFADDLKADDIKLDGRPADPKSTKRISRFLDRVRQRAGIKTYAEVTTANNFPTAAGLASSASGFAALTLAATLAAELDLSSTELAELARLGSGSAARSLSGGFVHLKAGSGPQGHDFSVRSIAPPDHMDLALVLAVNSDAAKAVGSSEGMERTRRHSPYYRPWIETNRSLLQEALRAVKQQDFPTLGRLTEASCFRMHAAMLATDPPLIYWNGATLDTIRRIHALRDKGLEGYVTIDAGPHAKVLCRRKDAEAWKIELSTCPGVERVLVETPGPGTKRMENS